MLAKYERENKDLYDSDMFIFNCPKCENALIPLEYVLYVIPWQDLVTKMLENLEEKKMSSTESQKFEKDVISMTSCSHKFPKIILRKSLFESLRTERNFFIKCNNCAKFSEIPFTKILTDVECRVMNRLMCASCKNLCPFFAKLSKNGYVCQKCFVKCSKSEILISGGKCTKISIVSK